MLVPSHYPVTAGDPGGQKRYCRIKIHFYWLALAVYFYATVRNCAECAKNGIKLRRNVCAMKLFPATAPLESIAIDILRELVRTPRGHRYTLVITVRFKKLLKAIPMKDMSASEVAKLFIEQWVFNYGPPTKLLSDNGSQFTSNFFEEVCRILNTTTEFTTTHNPQTNGQAERLNCTILTSLRSYIEEHPRDWDMYTPALTYAYNS